MAESARFEVAERRSAGYRSWKKKYRKMRITFDQKMHEGEELHKQEAKATTLVKRIAVENDRLLDLLLEVNNSPQIPPERRIDLAVKPSSDSRSPCLPMDRDLAAAAAAAAPSSSSSSARLLDRMIRDVPHSTYSASKASNAPSLADLAPPDGEAHPASFLSADDVDNYLYLLDCRLDTDYRGPTLAPAAAAHAHPAPTPALKNPTSVTNWLRKHAPKIFLQDGEAHDGPDDDHHHPPAAAAAAAATVSAAAPAPKRARSSTARSDRASTAGRPSAKGKRLSAGTTAAARNNPPADWDAHLDDDNRDAAAATPVPRGKRKRDEDAGYRPRGSGGRPSKKKRKDKDEATPSARKKKEGKHE